uniref:Uncharacterized protein n=1 Tax=Arundo donax TaxID=35708 RepID=A0A0A9AW39_ARUDO
MEHTQRHAELERLLRRNQNEQLAFGISIIIYGGPKLQCISASKILLFDRETKGTLLLRFNCQLLTLQIIVDTIVQLNDGKLITFSGPCLIGHPNNRQRKKNLNTGGN